MKVPANIIINVQTTVNRRELIFKDDHVTIGKAAIQLTASLHDIISDKIGTFKYADDVNHSFQGIKGGGR